MKKFLLISIIFITSCYFGEIEAEPEATKLLMRNQSSVELVSVSWNDVDFGNINQGKNSERIVPDGNAAYIFFFAKNGKQYRTQTLIPVSKYRRKETTFIDGTRIVAVDNAMSSLSLGEIFNAN